MRNIFKRKSVSHDAATSPASTANGSTEPQVTASEDDQFMKAVGKQEFKNPPRVLVIGAGSRGTAYARSSIVSTNATIAAVAEPDRYKRAEFGAKFIWGNEQPLPEQEFTDWKQWVKYEESRRDREKAGEKVEEVGVDAVFVCVLDEMHEEVVCGIAHLGVHICCEKPLSTSLNSCIAMYRALKTGAKSVPNGSANENGNINGLAKKETIFGICHVLRYSQHNMMLRHLLLDKEVIGDVLSIEHVEPVGWWHFSHSYVR